MASIPQIEWRKMNSTTLQWHPAFYAGIQIELQNEAEYLIFENEHQLGTKPREIDVLIIKKDTDKVLQTNIGKIFRTYNIMEYKSPADYLSIDTFYRVYAYACFYKSDAPKVNEIPAEEITISFICTHYPRKLINYLSSKRGCRVKMADQGIYYIEGDYFPMQIICIEKLSKEENFWLSSLTDRIETTEHALEIMHAYEGHYNEKLYESIVDIIVKANSTKFKEVSNMCESLEKIFAEKFDEKYNKLYDEKYGKLLEEKDIALEKKDMALKETNVALKEKDAYILELEKKLAVLTAQTCG